MTAKERATIPFCRQCGVAWCNCKCKCHPAEHRERTQRERDPFQQWRPRLERGRRKGGYHA